jgi:beta-lactamase regulating signal transducer with metallopeptidase domain
MNATADLMHTLTWSLLHFLWQGAAIAALAAAVMFVFRSSAARYLVGVASIALMFMSFGVTFASLNSAASDVAATGAATPTYAPASPAVASIYRPDRPGALMSPVTSQDDLAWVAQVWLAGVCLLALRIVFGLLFLERLRRRNLTALPDSFVERCRRLQQRLGISRVVSYCECRLVTVPAVIGLFRPIVLLPIRAMTGLTPTQLEAVIAHELGHIKRFDIAVNFFQVMAETLFFFHPAVWWLNKRIRADREDCCDDIAIAACGEKAGYVRALATMEGWRDVPEFALAATGGSVAARVARLLGITERNASTRPAGVLTATLVLSAALTAGAISMGLVQSADARTYIGDEPVLMAQVEPAPAPAPKSKPNPAPKPIAAAKPSKPVSPVSPASRASPASPANPASPRTSYIDQMKAAGYANLEVDDLIAMRVHEITPEYVKAIRDMGFSVDPDQIVGMKVHDITPEYVREIRALGFKPDADEIIAMKVHDITPDYVRNMRALGFQPNADELIALKVHEVTAEYRDQLAAAGYKLDVEQIIEAKVMDITTEFIEEVHAHGFKDLSIDQLIQLKNADVL